MEPWDLFNKIEHTKYVKSGFDLDWKIEKDVEEHKIRLLFYGSTTIKDWIVNIAGFFPMVKFPFVYCWGWKSTFDHCKGLIFEELIRYINENRDYKVEICGHSYGGAMSVIAALALYKETGIKADVITFGSPKPLYLITSKFLAKACLGKVVQYTNWNDIVPLCPPFLFYHNVTVKMIGKFNIKEVFTMPKPHLAYGDKSLYE